MAITAITTIKNWFKTGLFPTQEQFWAVFDSYRHKSEKVAVADVEGIDELLATKASSAVLNTHLTAEDAHAELFVKAKIYAQGQLQIFKLPTNEDDAVLEVGDYCIGFVEGQFINANYLGGDDSLLSSFDI